MTAEQIRKDTADFLLMLKSHYPVIFQAVERGEIDLAQAAERVGLKPMPEFVPPLVVAFVRMAVRKGFRPADSYAFLMLPVHEIREFIRLIRIFVAEQTGGEFFAPTNDENAELMIEAQILGLLEEHPEAWEVQ